MGSDSLVCVCVCVNVQFGDLLELFLNSRVPEL